MTDNELIPRHFNRSEAFYILISLINGVSKFKHFTYFLAQSLNKIISLDIIRSSHKTSVRLEAGL